MSKKYTCPCCGYKTLDEPCSWEICCICGWEDDPIQSEDVDVDGGANVPSLRQAQKNFKKFGVCEEWMISCAIKPEEYEKEYEKDLDWKPLD